MMRVLVTGSSGHLGEGAVRGLRAAGHTVTGLDLLPGPTTDVVGSIVDPAVAAAAVRDVDAVLHAATLHKPHVGSHTKQDFVDVNVTGTLNLLEASVAAGVARFVLTSSTSAFGRALTPAPGEPAVWVTEDLKARVRNVYGATKTAAEDLCELVAREHGLACAVLRLSRFFPEADDREEARGAFADLNLKVNELLHRRVDLADAVEACRLAVEHPEPGFDRFVISATTPFTPADRMALMTDAPAVLSQRVPGWEAVYAARGWRPPAVVERVYVNAHARETLGWRPRHDFPAALAALTRGEDPRSPLALEVGAKGYHATTTGVYTTRAG